MSKRTRVQRRNGRGGRSAEEHVIFALRSILWREKSGTFRWQPVSPTLMHHLQAHAEQRTAPPTGQLLRYRNGQEITYRRYDHLWVRTGARLPWVATQRFASTVSAWSPCSPMDRTTTWMSYGHGSNGVISRMRNSA
jgi:hypothetical protein